MAYAMVVDYGMRLADTSVEALSRGFDEYRCRHYTAWLDTMDILIGPYASALVRAVVPIIAANMDTVGTFEMARALARQEHAGDLVALPDINKSLPHLLFPTL